MSPTDRPGPTDITELGTSRTWSVPHLPIREAKTITEPESGDPPSQPGKWGTRSPLTAPTIMSISAKTPVILVRFSPLPFGPRSAAGTTIPVSSEINPKVPVPSDGKSTRAPARIAFTTVVPETQARIRPCSQADHGTTGIGCILPSESTAEPCVGLPTERTREEVPVPKSWLTPPVTCVWGIQNTTLI